MVISNDNCVKISQPEKSPQPKWTEFLQGDRAFTITTQNSNPAYFQGKNPVH